MFISLNKAKKLSDKKKKIRFQAKEALILKPSYFEESSEIRKCETAAILFVKNTNKSCLLCMPASGTSSSKHQAPFKILKAPNPTAPRVASGRRSQTEMSEASRRQHGAFRGPCSGKSCDTTLDPTDPP